MSPSPMPDARAFESTSDWYFFSSSASSMRLMEMPLVSSSTNFRCAAGSVVARWTLFPRFASPSATAAATVVFPTPPLPIAKITRLPCAASSSITSFNRGTRAAFSAWACAVARSAFSSARTFSSPVTLYARSGTM